MHDRKSSSFSSEQKEIFVSKGISSEEGTLSVIIVNLS
jgi:hypothetical protein